MKHRIDPKIDCVFKALLGSEENRNLLVHFLNAILTSDLAAPITEAEILNPYNDKEFLDDKLSVVDVKVKDSEGRLYQILIVPTLRRGNVCLTAPAIHGCGASVAGFPCRSMGTIT
jgi:hypothetical protein